MKQHILLTGGTGYIGSHTFIALHEAGFRISVLDNFSNSKPSVLTRLQELTGLNEISIFEGDVLDSKFLDQIFQENDFDAVVHFAALKAVGESMENPMAYYRTNVGGLNNLLNAMDTANVNRLVFSSSATVYGATDTSPIDESTPLNHINPYGFTKVASENMLAEFAERDEKWAFGILRYFNPVGAHSSGVIGDDPTNIPQNLMPFIERVAIGNLKELSIFGDDYNTPDGTGIRDYIHVMDLADGHVASLRNLLDTNTNHLVNIGTGTGSSVLEMVKTYEETNGIEIPSKIAPRRAGDVAITVADASKANQILGFQTKRNLTEICESSWKWINNNKND